ncbi:hypothetical protein A2U01_0054055, partial [Trifolium medium]|nr:hypothetical protein [Trifolium medium]
MEGSEEGNNDDTVSVPHHPWQSYNTVYTTAKAG